MARLALVLVLSLMFTMPLTTLAEADGGGPAGRAGPASRSSTAELVHVDSVSAIVEVPPQETRVLMVDHGNATLVPVDWVDPVEVTSPLHRRAVDRVEPWLKRDLATQLNRMGGNGNRYAQLIVDCPEVDWVDEIAFTVAHTPPEVLTQVPDVNVLRDNARQLYQQDADIPYADLVERSGEDGNYTTVSYVNFTGVRHEYPRDIYYYYVAHARVFWEDPAKVAGKSFWRKAYWDEISYEDSGTLGSWLAGASNIIEAANVSTLWMQMNMEFGYGTNPLQPVQVILERYGSCGQYSITTAASLKVAMIPARVAIYPASDHQWCEVYIDGHWMHLDASNDVAGQATVKEPELIRRTNTVNFNDAGVFERGWKPYMSAMSTFRSDDVVINSIDISAPDPSFTFRESGMTERTGAAPHMYTETSTVTIDVRDGNGDPMEGAWVGVFRVGHDIYNPDTPDYPHYAYANYTNATGQAEFELGLQGYCSRCGDDHYYAALILSRYNQGTNDFFSFSVPEENQEYSFSYTVTGDAPSQEEVDWVKRTDVGPPPGGPGDFLLNVSLEAWGRQRHTHGEYGQAETFGFRTSFDHLFPSDVDMVVVDDEGLRDIMGGNRTAAWLGATDAQRFEGGEWVPHDEPVYLVLSNTDSFYTTKVVNITVDLSAMCKPVMTLGAPQMDQRHNTDLPLIANGTLRDHIPIIALEASLDGGETWDDIMDGYDAANGTFMKGLNVSGLASNGYPLWIRATDRAGIWTQCERDLVLDADDPEMTVQELEEGDVLPAGEDVGLQLLAQDNLGIASIRARVAREGWVTLDFDIYGVWKAQVPPGDAVGPATLEVVAEDMVGRTTVVAIDLVFDALDPMLELQAPEPDDEVVIGEGQDVTVEGSVWDDNGVGSLRLMVDEGAWLDATELIDENDRFQVELNSSEWEGGLHPVTLRLTDLAGHYSERGFSVLKDVSPPVLVVDGPDSTYDDDEDVELTGTVTDDHDVSGLWVVIDGVDVEEVPIDLAGWFSVSLPSGDVGVGWHTVSLRATDGLGNEVTWGEEYRVLDRTDPSLEFESPKMNDDLARGKPIRISGSAVDNVGVTGLGLWVGDDLPQDIYGDLNHSFGIWSLDYETTGMPLGPLVIEVSAKDAAGNMVVRSVIVNLVDRTDPTLDLDVDPSKTPRVEKGKGLVVTATFSDDVAVTGLDYRVDGWSWVPACLNPEEAWDVQVPTKDLSTGLHMLEVRATDAAGNEAIESVPFEIEPVPEEPTMSLPVVAGIVIAAVVVLLLLYLVVLRRGSSETTPSEDVPEGDEVPEPEPDPGSEGADGPEVSDDTGTGGE